MDDVDQLQEELTCQVVMLSSLDGMGEEYEDERVEMRSDIARIKRLLERAKRGEHAVEDEEDEPTTSSIGSQTPRQGRPQINRATPGPVSDNHLQTPSAGPSRSNGAGASTPRREPLGDNQSFSLPSRKRELESSRWENGEAQRKSQRTTPTPTPTPGPSGSAGLNPPSGNSIGGDIDFIDLTGEDEVDADFIAQQIRAENREKDRQKQEQEDREMALLLSQANDELPDVPRPSQDSGSSAFDMLMSTQQLNSAPRQPREPRGPSPFDVDEWDAHRMPGGYDPSWDTSAHRGVNGHAAASISRGFSGASYPHGMPVYPGAQPTHSTAFSSPSSSGPYNPAANVPQSSANSSNFPVPGPTDALSNIINRTAGYDFINGLDALGNRLPERLTNYIQDSMHDTRMSENELDDLLKNIRPDMEIPEENRNGTPDGLKGTLYRHQELALTWLKQMEEGSNKGGILADDMGLGKTISMISLMIERKATARPKTNLIVAPVALLRQWEEEIRSKLKTTHKLSTVIFHQKKMTTEDLLRYDVVLTTYGTVAAELKRLEKLQLEDKGRKVDFNDKAIAAKIPLLHPTKASFHRVILDEAQAIKNRRTLTSKAVHQLRSTYRWCLTGTPMMNGVVELFSLLHFLKIKPYCVWERFSGAFGSLIGKQGYSRSTEMKRLRTVLKAIMLRRKKDSQIDGQPILRLPAKTEEEIHVALSEDERDFYDQLEKKSQVVFNKYLRENAVGKNYSNILVLLLRLRQACCHPHLNLDVEDAAETTEGMTDLVKALDPAIVARIKEAEAFECPICYDAVQNPSFFIPCGHDSCTQCLSQIVDNAVATGIREGTEAGNSKCPVCRGPFDPNRCFTYDAFQKVHMKTEAEGSDDGLEDEVDDSDDTDSDSDESDDDKDDVDKQGNLKGFIVNDEFASSDEDTKKPKTEDEDEKAKVETKKRKKKSKKKRKGKDRAEGVKPSMLKSLRQEANKNKAAFKRYMAYLRKHWLPSAKVTECMALLKRIEAESDGTEKTIIFSQWTLLLDLLEVAMHHEGFPKKPERYDGSMSSTQRNEAASAFRSKPDSKVILVSLRAGNAGLNLTAASRVIILDPFWNPYIEMQAVDRAYRIGQQREVKVYRILTVDTVEDRIVSLQQKKKEIVEAALDENESRKIGRLSTSELKFLFNG